MGTFKGTINKEGRPKGTKNKATQQVKEAFTFLVQDNLPTLQEDLQALEPKERVKMILELSRFVVPRLKDVEHKIEAEHFKPIVINWTNGED